MNTLNTALLLAGTAICFLNGCGVGQKKVLFTTQSNVGVNIDAKQLTAEINIDRQELVIGPTFENGQQLPVAAGFLNNNRFLGGFGVSSFFSGGTAAVKFTAPENSAPPIKLTAAPVFERGFLQRFIDLFHSKDYIARDSTLPGPGQVKPFVFDTDTSLGLKLAWSGSEYPDKVKIGFNREEFALAPVTMKEISEGEYKYQVDMPSFFAAIDVNSGFSSIFNSQIGYRQIFCYG